MKPQLDYPLHTIGYRDRCTVFSKKAEVVDWWVDTVLGPTGTEYGWMFPEHKGIYQSTVRYFTPYEDPPDYLLDDLENFLEKEFGSLLKACRTLTPWEIIANWQAAAGPLADGFCRELQTYYNMYPLHFAEFWDRAHLEDWPIYWKSTGKVEFLPMEKILAGIPRTFIFPDGPARIAGLRVTQDFNKKMLRLYEATSSAVGMSLYNGGWHRLGNLFQFMTWFGQCDASKWDGRYGPKLHRVVRNFRKKCHWHYEPRLDYIYDNLEHPLVFLPSGELVELDHGQPSGQWSTTPDNTLIHAAMMWLVGKAVCRSLDIEPTMVNILGGFLWKVYGDDLLFACSDQFAPHLEKMMRWIYSQFQFIVKPGAFSFGRELEGVEFLGGRFAVCEETGQWCYSPKPEKLLESAVRSDEAYDEGLQHDRCLSFFLIGFHTPERERLRTLYYCAHRRAILAGKTVPDVFSDLEIERFTHGLEGSDRLASFAEGHEPLKELIDVPWTSHN